MPWLERQNSETPCAPNGAHHPHRMWCSDVECDCADDSDDGSPFSLLECCVCGQDWPCKTKARIEVSRRQGEKPR